MTPTDDEREAYKRGRAAIQNLTSKRDRTFGWWLDYSNAVVAARTEAMRDAYTNQPIGKAYNAAHARIMKREKLDAFDANTRKDCVAMIDNLHHPVDARRAHGIIAWRSKLDTSTRVRLNHPSAIMRRWKKDTEPLVEKLARSVEEPPKNPFLDALADAEGERDDARRSSQDLRMLLYRVLGEVNDLPELLRAAIETALRGDMVAAPNQPEAELESADPDTLYKRAWARFLQEDPAKLAELPVHSMRSKCDHLGLSGLGDKAELLARLLRVHTREAAKRDAVLNDMPGEASDNELPR